MWRSLFSKIQAFLNTTNAGEPESSEDLNRNRLSEGLSPERNVLEDLGALAASIEHDIRNPLMVIQTELTLLREKRQADPEVTSHLRKIEEQLERIFAATQIVTLMRGRADFFSQYMEKTRIGDLINKTLKAVKKEVNCADVFLDMARLTPSSSRRIVRC
jgi:signal transduction histidine kinase